MRKVSAANSWLCLLLALAAAISTNYSIRAGTVLDPNFSESVFATDLVNLGNVTGMAWAPDGSNRLFVNRKDGQVRIIKNGMLLSTPFATLSPILTTSECGLLGICFDPDFVNNHYVYLFVTAVPGSQQVIRYTDANDVGTSKTVILSGLPTHGNNHDGGGIGIGWDGKIYCSIGDNGSSDGVNGDLLSMASKVIRLNRDGTVPNDNPFNDGAGPNNDYIWARGFRNPFTLTFQPSTGNLWVNTVGNNYEQVFVVRRGDHAGWNTYENNQPSGYITPIIVYRTNGSDTRSILANGAVRNNNLVTFSTTVAHGFRMGSSITVSGVAASSFNGSFYVASVPTPTTFTVSQAGSNQTSGGGTATTLNLGGCATGGCFYDSTAFPAAYRGNFFWGDYNSGRIMRAILDANNNVTSVDYFVSGVTQCVDVTTGPDGALYYSGVGGSTVYRLAYNASAQNLIVSPTAMNILEGGSGVFTVRLATQPASNVSVTMSRTSGDTDINISSSPTLTFTPGNYSTPQIVSVTAAQDPDTVNDSAVLSVASAGLATQLITVNAVDDDDGLLLSTSSLTINEASSGTFTVRLTSQPAVNVTVNVARTAGDTDITVAGGASLTFTPSNYATPQTVTIAAAADANTVDDTATITVTSPGLAPHTVPVTAKDTSGLAPAITSTPVTTAIVGANYNYDVSATGIPAPTYSLSTPPGGMTISAANGLVSWIPAATGNFGVTVIAANGIAPNATQNYTVTVSPDLPPIARLTEPANGAVVSGQNAEFFGDGIDDVATVKAEFYVDGVLAYTDINSNNHFHFGGAHNLWDTTRLSDGAHTVKFVVYDTKGQTGSASVTVTVSNTTGGPPVSFITGMTLTSFRNNYDGWLGMRFTVGSGPITITQLGRLWLTGNNLTHTIKLVDASTGADVPNGTASLAMAGGASGQFVYATLPGPVTLPASKSYYLLCQETFGGDQWVYGDATVTTTSAGTCDGVALSKTNGNWTFKPSSLGNTFGPLSFKYVLAGPPSVSPTVTLTSPPGGASYTAPASISIAANASDSDGTVSKVEFFQGNTLLGTDTNSPYSLTWNNVSAGNYTLTARATDNSGAATVSSAVNVTVTAGGSQTAFITGTTLRSFRNDFNGWLGMRFTVGSGPLTVTQLGRFWLSGNNLTHLIKLVDASTGTDVPNGSVSLSMAGGSSGQFVYATLPGAITLPPNTSYYLICQETPGGDQWAYDDATVTTTTDGTCDGVALSNSNGGWTFRPSSIRNTFGPVSFKYSTVNLSPTVAITSPADGASFTAPAAISITANASDSDGTVSKVDFFSGSNLLATAPTSPYAFVWNNVLAGNYALTARATDNLGAVGNSAAINVTVATGGASTPFVTSYVEAGPHNDFAGWLGMGFTVGSAPITVTQLGRLWLSGNSLTHNLKLVDASTGADVPNGSVVIPMAGGSAGQFVYGSLPGAITLLANTRYYLASQETAGGDQWAYDNTRVTTTSVATCDGPVLSNASGGWTLRLVPNTTFGPVNFK